MNQIMKFGMNQNRMKMIGKQGEMWNNYRRCSAVVKEGNEDSHHFYPKRNSRGACGMVCVCDARNLGMLPEIVLFLLGGASRRRPQCPRTRPCFPPQDQGTVRVFGRPPEDRWVVAGVTSTVHVVPPTLEFVPK